MLKYLLCAVVLVSGGFLNGAHGCHPRWWFITGGGGSPKAEKGSPTTPFTYAGRHEWPGANCVAAKRNSMSEKEMLLTKI